MMRTVVNEDGKRDAPSGPRRSGARYGINLAGQAAGRAIYLLAGFAAFVMVAKFAGPEALGHYGVALAVMAVAVTAADFGTTLTFGARLGGCRVSARPGEVAAMLSARLILGAAVGLALLLALPWLPAPTRPALALAALFMPTLAARFLDPLFQVCGRPGWSAYPSLANAAILVIGTALALGADAPEWVLPLVAVGGGLAYGVVGLVLATRLLRLRIARPLRGLRYLRRAFAVGVSNALGSLNARIGLMLVALAAGAVEAGLFTAGYRFFELGVAVVITVTAPLVPVFGRAAAIAHDRLRDQVRLAMSLALATAGPAAIAAWPLAGPVVDLLYGPDYAASVPVLRLAAIMSLGMLAATILFAGLVALRRTGFAIPFSLLGCGANLVLCLVLVPVAPVSGAAVAALGAEIAMLAVVAAVFWRAVGSPLAAADLPMVLAPNLVMALAVAASPPLLALPAGLAGAVACLVLLRPRSFHPTVSTP